VGLCDAPAGGDVALFELHPAVTLTAANRAKAASVKGPPARHSLAPRRLCAGDRFM